MALLATGPRKWPVREKRHRLHILLAAGGVALLAALNVGAYLVPIDYQALSAFAYPGAFVVCLIANAVVAIPVPYIPIVAHIGATAEFPALVVALAALGSVLGESVAYLVGRAEEGLLSEHAVYKRLHRVAQRPLLAGLLLFAFAVPLNPVFDVAGLAAGAIGVRYRIFFISVFLARLVRIALIVWLGVLLGFATGHP
jgi:membrane protein YqaA with SNARE-associated domain